MDMADGRLLTCLLRYTPKFGVREANLITLDAARKRHDTGEKYALLIGVPEDPDIQIEVFKTAPNGDRRIDVAFYRDLERTKLYICVRKPSKIGRDDLFLAEYKSAAGTDGPRYYDLFVTDVFVDGDLPTLIFDTWIPAKGEAHAVSVPYQDFFLGPFPTFDELIDGRFLARLPEITLPPKELWDSYIPQIERTPKTPKRPPRGRFPW